MPARVVTRLRRNVLGVFALSLIVGCSRTSVPVSGDGSAQHQAPIAAGSQLTESPADPAPAAQAEPGPAPMEAERSARAEEGAFEPKPEAKRVWAPPASPGKMKASAGGLASSSGRGRLGGAQAAAAPRAAATVAQPSSPAPVARDSSSFNTESYSHIQENPFLSVTSQPVSTFSIDVDTASYSNARRFLSDGTLPPKDSIRVEEWLNYFGYAYPAPQGDAPFAVSTEVTDCPWNTAHQLVRIGIKGKDIGAQQTPARNLVFLLDVSGSMMSPDKLPLVKRGLALLTESLRPQDSIAIVVYAGSSGLVLPATSGAQRGRILSALESLEAGGSTNGGAGIQLAYSVAQQQFKRGGINRVILATDGDFNVGTTSEGELQRLIEDKRKSGVFLTVLGFGTGNVKDSTMEMLANKGNGNYAYIDDLNEARKVLVREAGSTLITIAKDVKLQVEFNPARIASYKLIGYENRLLAREDFNDDKKDAGEIGAGHTVTALYEIVPKGAPQPAAPAIDPLKYQKPGALAPAASSGELLTVNIRYKQPQSDTSTKLSVVVSGTMTPLEKASEDARFGVAVANVALLLRGSKDVKQSSLDSARTLAASGVGADPHGDRREFLALVDRAKRLQKPSPTLTRAGH